MRFQGPNMTTTERLSQYSFIYQVLKTCINENVTPVQKKRFFYEVCKSECTTYIWTVNGFENVRKSSWWIWKNLLL